jgi:Zn-dependent peptidase ImmA (M78 family)
MGPKDKARSVRKSHMTMLPVFIAASIMHSRRGEKERLRTAERAAVDTGRRTNGTRNAPTWPQSPLELVNEYSSHVRPDLIELSRRLGFGVESIAMRPDLAGYVDVRGRRFVLNSDTTAMRQRFTLAHQIGHWVWDRIALENHGGCNDGPTCRGVPGAPFHNPDITQRDETYATKAAIGLIMSGPVVRGLHSQGMETALIAGRLGTTEKAMTIRLETLGLKPNAAADVAVAA